MKGTTLLCAAILTACAGGPQIAYQSDPNATQSANAMDPGEARALEQAESECARQGQHAVSQRVEGETLYDCTDGD
jgi:hypothetical protein